MGENFPTFMHRRLSVQPRQRFTLRGRVSTYYLDESGALFIDTESGILLGNVIAFAELMNEPEEILRTPTPTQAQIRHLEAAYLLGYQYLSKDKSGSAYGSMLQFRTVS